MLSKEDFSILNELHFDIQPVGIKYLVRAPGNIAALEQKMALCEMLKAAQGGAVFYADVQKHTCEAGQYILGQRDIEDQFVSGEFGAGLGLFREPRAAGRLYHYIPRIAKGVVNQIVLAPLDKLPFDPDVVIIIASIDQAEILLRAMSYENGQMWSSKYSAAIGCAWLFAYPYLSGEINFITTGLGFGMRRRKLFPQGQQFITIPFDRLSSTLRTLREMPWVPEPFKPHGLEFVAQLRQRLCLE
jgi:uncharacterized protein (DUF169 family)